MSREFEIDENTKAVLGVICEFLLEQAQAQDAPHEAIESLETLKAKCEEGGTGLELNEGEQKVVQAIMFMDAMMLAGGNDGNQTVH